MPVEIREMVVRAMVPSQEGQIVDPEGNTQHHAAPTDHARVVEECVAAVLKVLEKRERR
jgi:Family of unknown function (DUF5908)